MSTIERPPLATLSTNRLNVGKVSKISNADKLKYRLKLAYYKLQTNQIKTSANEILSDKQTPALTRHISLLAASTPLSQTNKKKVTFDHPTKAIFKISNDNNTIKEFKTFKPPVKLRSISFPVTGSIAKKFNHCVKPKVVDQTKPQQFRSLKIDDLCNDTSNNTTILQDDTDATINDSTNMTQILEKDMTPIKNKKNLIIGSSPSKMYMSTPGSYKAAKSLLELGFA